MNYEQTLKIMFNSYPSLFVNEADCINQLFFIIGNGYSWIDGELVGEDGDPKDIIFNAQQNHLKFLKEMFIEETNRGFDGFYYQKQIELYEENDVEKIRQKEIEKRFSYIDDGEGGDCWFKTPSGKLGLVISISEYSKIMTVPVDVTPDWLKASFKVIEMTKTDLVRATDNSIKLLADAYDRLILINQNNAK